MMRARRTGSPSWWARCENLLVIAQFNTEPRCPCFNFLTIAALLASRWVADLLYETSATDPMVYGGAGVVLVIAAFVASVVPARRSAAVDPAQAIRSE